MDQARPQISIKIAFFLSIIVTPQLLAAGSPGSALTVIDNGDDGS
ncbi:MAG TPA: hypothetical protein VK485_01820 [Sphingomicrobium sp.]|nr:hypothetical protein [Sphingomicrobium sp.]